ncbi:heme exporter protein B [Pedobacter steynii]|jgi:heme exporter protein B|uniref:Heme exporter protein B n=1 Tax=Pedobacter steynii TaxID=430522 RepID=A0A1G9YVB0_9SPHI|nr:MULTISPECIES: heme exporter protein CcmB [Pedobacter]NQX39833.1 heme exporter protein CcmB [Pedobacter steynii]RQO75324.1 ABC transporter permease [Pedobacter sp. KBW06]SDN12585.1 heme exporter protein B [Pedobacter steynii]
MNLIDQVKFLIKKELLLEWRSKYALNGVLLYVVSTVFVCYLSFVSVEKITWNALFWIIMLFASINAVSKSFLQESKGRQLYIYTIASPLALIISKTIYNVLLMMLLTVIALGFYTLVFNYVPEDLGLYIVATLLGSLSFSTIFTMVSAIASKAGNGGMLMAILSFPVIIPVLIVLIKLTKNAIDGLDRSVSMDEIGILLIINALVMAVSLILFPYLWRD